MCVSFGRETRKARKSRPCTWCGQRIETGQQYIHERVIVDGDPTSNNLHPECDEALRDAAIEEGGCFYFVMGDGERPAPQRDGNG